MKGKYSIAEARANLPKLVREAEAGKAVELTRRGEGVAVLIGRKDYERLVAGRKSFSEAYDEFVRTHDLKELDIDPDEVWAGVRSHEPGRDVKL